MAANYASIEERDLGAGIDQQSSENSLQPGYCERLLNVDPTAEGSLRKRAGYESHRGHLPVRVSSVQYSDDSQDNIILTLDTFCSLAAVRSTPVVVYGRISTAEAGDLTSYNSANYYPGFTITQPLIVATGTSTLTIPGTVHALGTPYIDVVVLEALGLNTASNALIEVQEIRIDASTYDVSVTLINSTGSEFSAYIGLADRSAVAAVTFVSASSTVPTGPHTISVPVATHQLENFKIMATVFEEDGGDLVKIDVDAVRIDEDGDVEIDLTNSTGSPFDVRVVLHRVPLSQTGFGTVGPNATLTVDVPDVTSAFNLVRVYLEDPNTGALEEVLADSVAYDEFSQTLSFTFTNGTTSAANFIFMYDATFLLVNAIQLTGAQILTSEQYVDLQPQLSVYGLDHREIYGTSDLPRAGWVHHIDVYRAALERRLVAGLGGVLHTEEPGSDAICAATGLHPRIRARIGSTSYLRPAFTATPYDVDRTRGSIEASNVDAANRAPIESLAYHAGSGEVRAQIRLTDANLTASLSSILSYGNAIADWITLEECAFSRHNGSFRIESASSTTDGADLILTVGFINPSVGADHWDVSASGHAAVRTDQIECATASEFIPGDVLQSESFLGVTLTVKGVDGLTVSVAGVESEVTAPDGLRVVGQRSDTACIPMRDEDGIASIENIVKGDSISVTDQVRRHTVKHCFTQPSTTVSIEGNGTSAEVTANADIVKSLSIGQRFLLSQCERFAGEHVVTGLIDDVTFSFAHSYDGAESALLVGDCLHLDEVLTVADPLNNQETWAVDGRFIPIDQPASTQSLIPPTRTYLLRSNDTVDQPIVRSTLISDSMFLTNGQDEVYKYDGLHVYRAGLFRWQARLFATPDVGHSAKIEIGNPEAELNAGTPNDWNTYLLNTDAHAQRFLIGDAIVDNRDGASYTVTGINLTDGIITVDRFITGTGAGYINRATELTYYARLNLIDRNGYIVASASTGVDDTRVVIGADAAVRLRLLAPPPIGLYDFDRMEVEVYRREPTTLYRRVRTISVPYENAKHYIDVIDTDAPDVLSDLDPVVSVLDPDGLGQTWSEPLRAKHVTSADGKLLLGNVRSYPEINLQWTRVEQDVSDATLTAAGNSVLTLRRDEEETSSSTDMHGTVRYEWRPVSSAISATVTNLQTFVDGDVDVGDDEISLPNHLLQTGDRVRFTNAGGALPGGISAGTDYWIIVLDAGTIQLANSFANAILGTAIDVTSAAGGGTHSLRPQDTARSLRVSATALNATVGGWIYLFHSTESNVHSLAGSGWFQVAIAPNANSAIVRMEHAGLTDWTSNQVDRVLRATDPEDVPVPIGTDGNYFTRRGQAAPLRATSLRVGVTRLADAINASMRCVDRSISGFEDFSPWIVAEAGGEFSAGQLTLKQPFSSTTNPGVELDELTDDLRVFGNGVRRSAGDQVGAQVLEFPSRVLISYGNFAEIFDAPLADPTQSQSAVDVNPADGQEVTGLIPFFGESAFGSAQKAGIVVVFKTSSIYLLDVNSRQYQRIDSQGLGCTAPASIAYTRDAICFANSAGIYRLTQDLKVSYLGQKLKRLWQSEVDRNRLDLATGHHYAEGKQYKLSVPALGDSRNSLVFAYDHTREYVSGSAGSWTQYDAHPATGWCNRESEAFFSSTVGRVFQVRGVDNERPYRDDDAPIEAEATLRAMDFGVGGMRKQYGSVVTNYRTDRAATSGTTLEAAVDLSDDFEAADQASIKEDRKIQTIQYSLPNCRGTHLQLRYRNASLDEGMEIASIDFRVAATAPEGIRSAKSTRT